MTLFYTYVVKYSVLEVYLVRLSSSMAIEITLVIRTVACYPVYF